MKGSRRREILRRVYGFDCRCDVCVSELEAVQGKIATIVGSDSSDSDSDDACALLGDDLAEFNEMTSDND